ncbi:MAG: phosphotransferase [Bacteroidales bacterium]|nr:phosphotransferase [Bacteroidales bacterium]
MGDHIHNIRQLIERNHFPAVDSFFELPAAGSGRTYFRVFFRGSPQASLLACFNESVSENIAQFSFTRHFLNKGLRVPEIIARDETYRYFLLEDLGDKDLFQLVQKGFNQSTINTYKQVILDLLKFQTDGFQGIDLDVAHPVRIFNKKAVLWDLNYFKYYFVKPHNIVFDENKLEDDFRTFATYLLGAEMNFFNYRDFQSRNIMLKDGLPWYIDFQGGRQGPLQYDLVSLLYQAKAKLPEKLREELLGFYLDNLEKILPGKKESFLCFYNEYILFRTLQVLGAYGFRGKVEGKAHFLESIPFALQSLRQILKNRPLHFKIPELQRVLESVAALGEEKTYKLPEGKLTVNISSFSYKKTGIPADPTDNGGGFVFDCRALPNPHRDKTLRDFNGKEPPVVAFLDSKTEMQFFLKQVFQLVEQSCDSYLRRNFSHLQISFGCTGGKHRSVYSAEKLANHLSGKFGEQIEVRLHHHLLEAERRAAR